MVPLLVCAFIVAATLYLLAAAGRAGGRMGPARSQPADERTLSPSELRGLVIELLDSFGLTVVEEELRGAERRLVAVHRQGLARAPKLVVFVEPWAEEGQVRPLMFELATRVRTDRAAVGLLITQCEADPVAVRVSLGKLAAPVQLIDGPRLRALVARRLGRVRSSTGARLTIA